MSRKDTLHGSLRGADAVTQSRIFEGRFGRMFRDLPPAEFGNNEQENLDVLKKLGGMMISKANIKETEPNPEEGAIPAGYTFLGQFIDHDITFDPVSSLQRDNDLNAMVDYRTPRFDLDSVYGRGPDDQPYLYRDDGYRAGGIRMVLGRELTGSTDERARDVPRNLPINQQAREAVRKQDPTKITVTGLDQVTVNLNTLGPAEERAVIGDPRNDENVILAQLHAMFLRFHNRMTEHQKTADFTDAQRIVRWHYQWVILHDFLPRIVGKQLYSEYLPYIKPKSASDFLNRPELPFYRPKNEAYIPIEFSAAAYRFGHSMVRRKYRLNRNTREKIGGPIPIMGGGNRLFDLRGFRFFQTNWAIDWDLFFDGISPKAKQKRLTPNRVQPAFKIDTALVQPLAELPFEFTKDLPSLPQRNLIRGWRVGLPSGEAIAHAMGIKPISDPKVKTVGKNGKAEFTSIGKLPEFNNAFRNNTPLWFYILAEAQEQSQGEHLGQVGGRIVLETLVGLMLEDHHSFLRQEPLWEPKNVRDGGTFHMADFIREASQA